MFQKTLDDIFDILCEKYGYNDDIIKLKEQLLISYLNEEKNNNFCEILKSKNIIIKPNGDISLN